jgi:hypothetical protein
MRDYEIRDYFIKADDHYYTAMNLYTMYITDNFPYHKFDPLSKIANNCELAGELNIKAYMCENKIAFENTHSLTTFLGKCLAQNELFISIEKDISLLSGYTSKINYPNDIHINKGIINKTIEATKNILFFEEILKLRLKYGVQLPMSKEEIRNKIINDEQNAYIMAIDMCREKLDINIPKQNILKIRLFLKDNHFVLSQNIEKKKDEILQDDKRFGSYRILLEVMPEALDELKKNQDKHEKSKDRNKNAGKTHNDTDIDR